MFNHVPRSKVEGISLAILLVVGILTVGVPNNFGLRNARATGETITASKSSFFGSNVVEVTINDPNLKDNNDAGEEDEATVSFEVFSGGDTASDDVTIGDDALDVSAEIGDSGKLIFYLTADQDVVIGDLDDPEFGTDSKLVSISENGDIAIGLDSGNDAFGAATDGISLDEGATIDITYGDATVTLTYQDAKALLSLDRTLVGSDGFVYLRVNDQDANNDPTGRDELNFDNTIGNLTMTYTGAPNKELGQAIIDNGLDFKETTDNSGIFEVRLSVNDVFELQANETPKSVTVELKDFEVYPNDNFYDSDEAGVLGNDDTSKSFTVDNSDGILQEVTNPATPSSELKVVVSDPDRNLDSKVKDRIVDAIAADLSSGSTNDAEAIDDVTANIIDLVETGVNTGKFVPDTANNLIEVTIQPAIPNNGIVEIDSAASAKSDLLVRYGDITPDDSADLNTDLDDDGGDVNDAKTILFKGKAAANTPAVISLGQTQIGAQDKAFVVITDPDLNDDSGAADSFELKIDAHSFVGGTVTVGSVLFNTVDIADLKLDTITDGEDADDNNPMTDITLSFQETGDNTGIFAAEFEYEFLASPASTEDGDNTEFTWFDQLLDSPLESSARLTINEASKALQWQQSSYAIPFVQNGRGTVPSDPDDFDGKRTRIKLLITDPALNQDSSTVEQKAFNITDNGGDEDGLAIGFRDLTVKLVAADGDTLLDSVVGEITACGGMGASQTFTETGANTGIFDRTFDFNIAASGACELNPDDLANARLVANYGDETASTLIKANSAILTTTSKTINSGQEITITVNDMDQNHDRDVKEQVLIEIEPDGLPIISKLLDETDLNSGIFAKKLKVGEDFEILDGDELVDDVTVRYDDAVTSDGGHEEREMKLIPPSSDAKLTINPANNIGPGTKVTITLVDADLNDDPNSEDIIDFDSLEIGTDNKDIDQDSIALGDDGLQMEETDNNSAEFKLTMTLVPITKEMKDNNQQIAFLPSGDEIDFPAEPGDTIAISYDDKNHDKNGENNVNVIMEVKSFDPVISTDKDAYLPGDSMIVSIADPDANRDPDVIDVVSNVRIYTDADRVGEDFDAVETSAGTGVFTIQVPIVDDFEADAVMADIGDTITIEYTDDFAADYDSDDPDEKKFTYDVIVGKSLPNGTSGSTTPSPPTIADATGKQLNEVSAGQQIILATIITNNLDVDQPFMSLIEVRNSNDITIFLAWQTGTLNAEGNTEVGLSFQPREAGDYRLRTFVISDLANPTILSEVQESRLTVT